MSTEYRNNHYVPVWYQKRFVPAGQTDQEFFYLDLKPGTITDPTGVVRKRTAVRRTGFGHCFAETDLYTTRFGSEQSTKIEQVFFGSLDSQGRDAVEYFTNFTHPFRGDRGAFQNMMVYMSTQKLRTPKGLGWLSSQVKARDRDQLLSNMLRLRQLHCAIWTECVWLIADASGSPTKFIVSDHPVTVYNRRCGPRSQWCRDYNDPDIWLQATQTIFPLSLERVLILTNLSWVRNPYQSETDSRPNPNPWRSAIFNFNDIQILRQLSEQEVRQINFIIKSRSLRYVAAEQEEWLYPDKHVSKSQWKDFGDGYLLMPDPRSVTLGGEIMIGYQGGGATSFDPYGHRPWQSEYGKEATRETESRSLYRFQGEFARLYGPYRRGRSFFTDRLDNERDSDDFHQYHLRLEKK